MRHTFECHSSEPNFRMSCRICSQTFSNYSSMSSHISRKHKGCSLEETDHISTVSQDLQITNVAVDTPMMTSTTCDIHPQSSQTHENQMYRSAALFLLTLKEKYNLTQTTVDFAVSQVQQMVKYALEDLKDNVLKSAHESGYDLPMNIVDAMDTSINPFQDLHSEHMQTKFFKEYFNIVVSNVLTISHIAFTMKYIFVENICV